MTTAKAQAAVSASLSTKSYVLEDSTVIEVLVLCKHPIEFIEIFHRRITITLKIQEQKDADLY